MSKRPAVSVVVPFASSGDQLADVVQRLATLDRSERDELIVAVNQPGLRPLRERRAEVTIVDAAGPRSAGFARNAGARRAGGEWLVFIDADTYPDPRLLGAYFDPVPGPGVAVLAGAVEDMATRPTLAARYACSRRLMDQDTTLRNERAPYAKTANCAVRREAFEAVGGFAEPPGAGAEDADLCWRLRDARWALEERPRARVRHEARDTLRGLAVQLAAHGRGATWLNRRYPGAIPVPTARQLAGRVPHYLSAALREARRGDRERALFALIDLLALYAFDFGRLRASEPLAR